MRIAHPNRCLLAVTPRSLPLASSPRLVPPLHSLSSLSKPPPALAMAGAPEPVDTASAAVETSTPDGDDLKFGFRRPEMHKSSLAGTVDPPYGRHIFLCHRTPAAWPSRVEDSESDTLPKLLASALKSRKDEITVKTRLTICEAREDSGFAEGNLLIFPEMVKYRGLKESEVDSFVEDVVVKGKPWGLQVQVLTGWHVFICAHGSRDRRCGVCGPALIEKFREEIEAKGLNNQVFVSPCSHIGGHKYAGNLIIFSPNQEGKVMGHWYGYVTPSDVKELLDQHIGKGEIIVRLWRGQMDASLKEGENESKEQLANGMELKKSKHEFKEGSNQSTGCCQGANGFSCCREGKLEITMKKGSRKLSAWLGTWEQGDFLAAAAVVGAVATVAVAFSLYKRPG